MKPTKPINVTGRSDWSYTTEKESSKPGYLARKFAAIRKQQREEAERRTHIERISKVRTIR